MEPEEKFFVHNGVRMIADWPAQIERSQIEKYYAIGGSLFESVRYGYETDDWGADVRHCCDFFVTKGQLHVPGCVVECCPKCENQAISCDCEEEDE